MKVYIEQIYICNGCPNIGADINITRFHCEAKGDRFLIWMGDGDDNINIPEWCPLPDELLTEKDMEI